MRQSYKILVVDDNEPLCKVLCEVLNDEGYSITAAYNGEKALNRLASQEYHLILIDLKLPDINGMQVLHEVKGKYPGTDAIIMTSHASMETAVEALRLGAQDYLFKPFESLDIVTQVVRKAIEKRRIVEENKRLNIELKTKAEELEASVKRLSSFNRIGQAIHSILDFKELLNFLVQLVATALSAERVLLMLFNKGGRDLLIEASVGIDQELARKIRIRKGEGIAGWVAQKGEAILIEDINQDARFKKYEDRYYDIYSSISAPHILSVPIKYQQRTMGVIYVNNKSSGGSFTQNDLEFVTTIAGQAAIATENTRIFQELEKTRFEAITALGEALEVKDVITSQHSNRILRFAIRVAERLGLDECEKDRLRYAAVLHDIGKIGVPERILQKPEKLTKEEYNLIKQHPCLGAKLIKKISFLSIVSPLIYAHHEWYNGEGYPRGISGQEIPIEARIVAVMDAYDAMISDRPYRKSLGRERAILELKIGAGSQFDPMVVKEFLHVLDEHLRSASDMDILELYERG